MRSYGKFLFSMLMAAIALSSFSCGGKDGAVATTETQSAAPRMSAKAAAFTDTAVFDDVVMEEAVEAEMDYGAVPEPTVAGASGGGSGGQNPAEQQERKLIKTGSISLEVEQLGRCILTGEQPHVTEEFTLRNGRVLQTILEKIGY